MNDEGTTFFERTKAKAIAWRIALLWFCLFSINSLCSAVIATLAGKYWSQMNPEDRFTAIVAILLNFTTTQMAFLSSAAKKVERGESPINGSSNQPKP